jgi:hypothetical protein
MGRCGARRIPVGVQRSSPECRGDRKWIAELIAMTDSANKVDDPVTVAFIGGEPEKTVGTTAARIQAAVKAANTFPSGCR